MCRYYIVASYAFLNVAGLTTSSVFSSFVFKVMMLQKRCQYCYKVFDYQSFTAQNHINRANLLKSSPRDKPTKIYMIKMALLIFIEPQSRL